MAIVKLSELLGQSEVCDYLRRVVGGGRYANAYLFHGPHGAGKGTAALAFGRALLCERAGGARAPGPELLDGGAPAARLDDACGECPPCLKSAALQHPDLRLLFPVSGEERGLEETIAETLAEWREDPFYVFVYEKAASIRLSVTRDLLRELAFKPYEAERRVVVVRDADRMREDQYSAMLKSIEEPGASTVWVLTTARPSRLPATIRSRCQRIRFMPLPEKLVADFLQQRAEVSAVAAPLLAALSCGSLARALALRESDPLALRNQALSLVESAMRGDGAGLWKAVQSFNQFGRAGRETLRRLLEYQELWLRDLLRARFGADAAALANRDRESEIRRQAQSLDATEIRRRLMVLEEALRAIEGNVTADLALFSAMMRIAEPALSETRWPPHATGRWRY